VQSWISRGSEKKGQHHFEYRQQYLRGSVRHWGHEAWKPGGEEWFWLKLIIRNVASVTSPCREYTASVPPKMSIQCVFLRLYLPESTSEQADFGPACRLRRAIRISTASWLCSYGPQGEVW